MSRLSAGARKRLPRSSFAVPQKRSASGGEGGYPVPDSAHARAALSRVSANGSPAEKAAVRRKVKSKFPGIAVGMALGGPVPEPDVDNPKGFAKGGMAHGPGCSCKMCRGGMA